MKKIGLIFLCTLIFTFGYSQEKKYTFGVDLMPTFSKISRSTRSEIQLGFSVYNKRHQLRIAPMLHLESSEASNNPQNPTFSGGALSYYYSIPTESKWFNLYFKYELTIQFYEAEWVGNFYDFTDNVYKEYINESHEYFFGNSVAYGLTINLSKHVYVKSDIAVGFYLSNITGAFESEVHPNTNTRIDFRGYDANGFFTKFSAAFGYRF